MTLTPRWTPAQDAMLKEKHGLTDRDLADRVSEIGPPRSIQAVKHRRQWILLYKPNPVAPGIWGNADCVAKLTHYYGQGHSASLIASMLNLEFKIELTRNAVIGKAHRLGLMKPEQTQVRRTAQHIERRVGSRKSPKPPKAARNFQQGGGCVVDFIPKDPRPVRVVGPLPMSLNLPMWHQDFGGCRYPTSADDAQEITFCCLPIETGSSYCPSHNAACCGPVPASGPKSAKELVRSLRRYA